MTPELERLITMHTYRRPAGSKSERKFINRYVRSLGATPDAHGNYSVVVGTAPRIVWSSHTDTVHRHQGKQQVRLSADGILSSAFSDCLGADDTTGVWLMCELIRRKVPGRYIFHYGEEQGCIGSRALVDDAPDWIADTDAVIALDRKGCADIITHQCGMRTASDVFAQAIADHMSACGLVYAPSDRGLFTDSESYADTVAECTNLSVGYLGQHSEAETLDTGHALRLLECLSVLDTSALPIERTPGDAGWDDTYPVRTYSGMADDATFWEGYHSRSIYLDDAFGEAQKELQKQLAPSSCYICEECGLDYFISRSNAEEADRFCSPSCERNADWSNAELVKRSK